jgi:hypothetical protein
MIAEEVIAAAEAADRAAADIPEAQLAEITARNEVRLERGGHRRSHLDEIEAALAGS